MVETGFDRRWSAGEVNGPAVDPDVGMSDRRHHVDASAAVVRVRGIDQRHILEPMKDGIGMYLDLMVRLDVSGSMEDVLGVHHEHGNSRRLEDDVRRETKPSLPIEVGAVLPGDLDLLGSAVWPAEGPLQRHDVRSSATGVTVPCRAHHRLERGTHYRAGAGFAERANAARR